MAPRPWCHDFGRHRLPAILCPWERATTVPPLLCLQLFLFRTVTLRPPHNFTQCTTRGSFAQPWHETLYNMLGFSCLFLLPLLIMVSSYTRILLEISRRMGSSLCECPGTELLMPGGTFKDPGMEGAGWAGLFRDCHLGCRVLLR